jgi:hypothetical protein
MVLSFSLISQSVSGLCLLVRKQNFLLFSLLFDIFTQYRSFQQDPLETKKKFGSSRLRRKDTVRKEALDWNPRNNIEADSGEEDHRS